MNKEFRHAAFLLPDYPFEKVKEDIGGNPQLLDQNDRCYFVMSEAKDTIRVISKETGSTYPVEKSKPKKYKRYYKADGQFADMQMKSLGITLCDLNHAKTLLKKTAAFQRTLEAA